MVLSLDVGGLERVVLDLVRAGRAWGQETIVICLERPGLLAPCAEAAGIPVFCVEKPARIHWATIQRLQVLFDQVQPDVVHTHQLGALCYAGPAARRRGNPVVVHTEHGLHPFGRLRTRLLARLAGRWPARFFAVSREVAAAVSRHYGVPHPRVHVVANGIDPAPFRAPADPARLRHLLGIQPGAAVVGTVGRLTEIKRQDLLLRAFAEVKRQVTDAHLLLVGDGPLRADLQRLAMQLNLGNSVHLVGQQSRPQDYLGLMSVFTLTSRSEGLPLAVLEAWASGVPVIAAQVGGLAEIIEDGRNGLLLPTADASALAGLVIRLLRDAPFARRLAEAGRQCVAERFTLPAMVNHYQGHYQELLGAVRAAWGGTALNRDHQKG